MLCIVVLTMLSSQFGLVLFNYRYHLGGSIYGNYSRVVWSTILGVLLCRVVIVAKGADIMISQPVSRQRPCSRMRNTCGLGYAGIRFKGLWFRLLVSCKGSILSGSRLERLLKGQK